MKALIRYVRPGPRVPVVIAALAATAILLSACGGSNSDAAACRSNVAVVNGTAVTEADYRVLLAYTLGYYEHGSSSSVYYGRRICHDPKLAKACASIKQKLQRHMVDESVVDAYAAAHNLIPTSADWVSALARERKLVGNAGGAQAFMAYLHKLGTDQAEFRVLEGEQIETAKVRRAIGRSRFDSWLAHQEQTQPITRCPLA